MKARIAKKIIKKYLFNRWYVEVADTREGNFRILSKGCINLLRTGHWKKEIIRELRKQGNLDGNLLFHHIMMPTGKLIEVYNL